MTKVRNPWEKNIATAFEKAVPLLNLKEFPNSPRQSSDLCLDSDRAVLQSVYSGTKQLTAHYMHSFWEIFYFQIISVKI